MARMSEKDFRERDPDWGKNNSSPCSDGTAVWEEAKRARESEARLVEALKGLLFILDRHEVAPEVAGAHDATACCVCVANAALREAESNG